MIYADLKCFLLVVMMTLALPGCAGMEGSALQADDSKPLIRYSDVPPQVDPAVQYQLPVNVQVALAGNYGELRPNHFHGGLDFKTNQTTGHPVYSFADGFVRRVAINAYGYGLVLYVEHPALGLTSVYGHLEGFSQKIWQLVRQRQVSEQLNNADLTFGPGELPVRRGEVIARSGNTGSSGGPHVHFELRNIPDDDNDIYYDPMMFFLRELKDTQAPRVLGTFLYSYAGEGVANSKAMTAWGRVGLGIKAYDYMDGQSNKYGIKVVRLMLELPAPADGGESRWQLLYQFRQDAFRYSETRFTNSVTDYAEWMTNRSMIMKSFVEPGNLLQQCDPTLGDGWVNIDEERTYHFLYELEDAHGNLTSHDVYVRGVRQAIPSRRPTPAGWHRVSADQPLRIDTAGCRFEAPRGVFYTDADFRVEVTNRATVVRQVSRRVKNRKGKWVTVTQDQQVDVPCVSRVYTLGDRILPMHSWCSLSIAVPDSLRAEASQLYLTNVESGGSVRHSAYDARRHCMTGQIREGGRYAIRIDRDGPQITLGAGNWQRMKLTLSDAGSGVASFTVLIDGKFVPFDMDNTGQYFGTPCHYGIAQGRDHRVEVVATDLCGNETRVVKNLRF